jgi:hypothetical protein
MSGRHASTTAMFAFAASAVAAFALVLAFTAPDRRAHRRSEAQRTTPQDPGAPRSIAKRSPRRPPPPPPARASRRDIARVATAFALAYLRWDAGRHTRGVAATLHRLSTPALWGTLRHQRGRPTARRPRPARIQPLEIALGSDGRWRVPLTSREPAGRYLGTVVLTRGPTGVRVTAVDR